MKKVGLFTALIGAGILMVGCSSSSETVTSNPLQDQIQGEVFKTNLQVVTSKISLGMTDGSIDPKMKAYGPIERIATGTGVEDFSSYGFLGYWDASSMLVCVEGTALNQQGERIGEVFHNDGTQTLAGRCPSPTQ